jgi:hypothetical protein
MRYSSRLLFSNSTTTKQPRLWQSPSFSLISSSDSTFLSKSCQETWKGTPFRSCFPCFGPFPISPSNSSSVRDLKTVRTSFSLALIVLNWVSPLPPTSSPPTQTRRQAALNVVLSHPPLNEPASPLLSPNDGPHTSRSRVLPTKALSHPQTERAQTAGTAPSTKTISRQNGSQNTS